MMLFDIQRNSSVDGPGIRTTVFFKGCNLKCKWCHNPESQSFEKQMMFYPSRCTGCGKCREKCPSDAIGNPSACILCGLCETYCLQDARKICGREYTTDEVMRIIRKDRRFFEKSGGGVTFSGGESMLQPEALLELLKVCRAEGIHTAVDTAGCVPYALFEEILPYTDLFLYDLKAFTSELHRELTGVGNELILENFLRLRETDVPIHVRVPVIGGANDDLSEMAKLANFLREHPVEKVELLPYHGMGNHKYEALGWTYEAYHSPESVNPAHYQKIRALFGL